ncbi:hypothetical protein FLL45_06730 [Aliikangiella marina]|uniref:SH3 domain-containing protein n=1 Tax=Aliikangiella marina TaxID=1712262 RepID=A0A545TBQ3_9GAMM|nr:hypothetical protein [Aliikangiella marina]TQV74652.1 hypothetical protein FLL45_06730 [Aliikangiella marina]
MKLIPMLLLTAFTAPAMANVNQQLTQCLNIKEDTARLECYDAIAKAQVTDNQGEPVILLTEKISEAVSQSPNTANVSAAPQNVNAVSTSDSPTAPSVTPKPSQEATKQITASQEDLFGKTVSEIHQLRTIRSTIVGQFKGWKKGAIITLDNGQKWKVVSNSRGYVNLSNPKVVIEKGGFGDYKIKAEGLNAQAKVKRVK